MIDRTSTPPASSAGGGATRPPAAAAPPRSRRGVPTLVRHLLYGVVGLVVIYALSMSLDSYNNLQVANVMYYICAAAGLSVLTGLSGQISLGQGAFMAVGAYSTALLFERVSQLPLGVVLLLATVVTAGVGLLVGAAAARLEGPYLAGATLAFAIGLPAIVNYRELHDILGGSNGLVVTSPPPPEGLGDLAFDRWQLWVAGICAVITLVLLANLTRSRIGRTWGAVRDDEVAAELAGIDVRRVKIVAFIVSAACAGIAGALLAYLQGLAAPGAFSVLLSLQILAAVVLGGLGTLGGAIYGALLLVFLPPLLSNTASGMNLPDQVFANLPLAIYGVVLILVMILFPGGVQGGLLRLKARLTAGRGRR